MADEQQEQQPEQSDLRTLLVSAMDEAEAKEKPEATQEPDQVEATPETPAESKAEEIPAEPIAAAPEATEAPEKPEPEPEALDSPAHWSLEHQEMFRGLEPKAQAFLMDRSKDMEAAHTRRSQEIAPLRNAQERWTPYLQQIQADPAQMFDSLVQHEYALRTGTNQQKLDLLFELGRVYGVTLPENGNGQPSPEEDPFQIQQKIQAALMPLAQRVQQLTGQGAAQQQQAQVDQVDQAAQNIQAFRDATGDDKKPSHPYFAEVEADMLAMAQAKSAAGQPLDLAELYESACWTNASVREKMQASKAWQSRKTEQQRAARATTAAGSLAGGGGGSTEQPQDRRAAIGAAWDAST